MFCCGCVWNLVVTAACDGFFLQSWDSQLESKGMLVTAACGQIKACELSIALHSLTAFPSLHEGQMYSCCYFADVGSVWTAVLMQLNRYFRQLIFLNNASSGV